MPLTSFLAKQLICILLLSWLLAACDEQSPSAKVARTNMTNNKQLQRNSVIPIILPLAEILSSNNPSVAEIEKMLVQRRFQKK